MSQAVKVPRRKAVVRRERRRRLRRMAWNVVGLAVFVIVVFPVFWMISDAFKPDVEISSFSPTWFSRGPRCSTSAMRSIPSSSRVLGRRQKQPGDRQRDGRALDRARVPRSGGAGEVPLLGTKALRRPDDRDPDALAAGLVIRPTSSRRYGLTNQEDPLPTGALTGVIVTFMTFLLPFAVWTLRGFILGVLRESRRP